MNKTIFALGFFDGVHLGHQALLTACRRIADSCGCQAGVITFAAHPDTLVTGSTPGLLNTLQDRQRLLTSFGMDRVLILPFDHRMRTTPWEEFLLTQMEQNGAAGFVCGADFRFGIRGEGTAELLADFCCRRGLPCAVVPEQMLGSIRISSTHIRTLLTQGQAEQMQQFLGHPHILTGTVVPGKQLGRRLGIPTANLAYPQGLAIPRFGVYACRVELDGKYYAAVTNVGIRPTVSGEGITVEPWILDYNGNLYGRTITLEFHTFLRPEVRFPDLSALQAEIFRNAETTRKYFSSGNFAISS